MIAGHPFFRGFAREVARNRGAQQYKKQKITCKMHRKIKRLFSDRTPKGVLHIGKQSFKIQSLWRVEYSRIFSVRADGHWDATQCLALSLSQRVFVVANVSTFVKNRRWGGWGGLGRASGVNRGTGTHLIAYHTIEAWGTGRRCGFNTKHQSTKDTSVRLWWELEEPNGPKSPWSQTRP